MHRASFILSLLPYALVAGIVVWAFRSIGWL